MTSVEHFDREGGEVADDVKRLSRTLVWVGSTLLVYFVLKVSWLADDAYITLRTVDNLLNGFGLRWNVAERVQVYTHPLWMLLVIPFKAVCASSMLALLVPAWLTAFATFPLFFRSAQTPLGIVGGFAVLALSQSFIDFSTSGLEGPLSHLLIVCLFLSLPSEGSTVGRMSLCFGLLLLNRLDLLVLVAPLVGVELWKARETNRVVKVLLASSPLALWMLFACIYYGSPIPNTYFAKVGAAVPTELVLLQATRYFLDVMLYEPLTLAVVIGALVLAWRARQIDRTSLCLAAGVALHLAYIFKIGGDFMNARFLTPDVLVSAWITMRSLDRIAISSNPPSWAKPRAALPGILVVAAILIASDFHSFASRKADTLRQTAVTDERAFYFGATGLWPRLWGYLNRDEPFDVAHGWANLGRQLRREQPHDRAYVHVNMGFLGYYAGPGVHIIDRYALTDAFLARLPVTLGGKAGHWSRTIPGPYISSIDEGKNLFLDQPNHDLFEDVLLVTRSTDLLSWKRLAAVWRMNTGHHVDSHPTDPTTPDARGGAITLRSN
jgi:arabinofuranosyltransferase